MSITNRKIAAWDDPISDEADHPARTPSELKGVFDSNSNQLKDALNGTIEDLAGLTGAEQIGVGTIEGLTGNNLWALIVSFFNKVFGTVKTDQPSNRFLNGAGQYTVPSVGAAANGLPMGGTDNAFLMKNGAADFAADWGGADAVRSALNVADGADVTGTKVADAEEVTAIGNTNHLLVYTTALKKITFAGIISSIKKALFGTASGLAKLNGLGGVSEAEAGTDYATPGQVGAKYDKPLIQTGISVPTTAWASDTTYSAYPYRASITVEGAEVGMIPFVAFSANDAALGILAPSSRSHSAGIYIYVSSVPSAAVTIETLMLMKGVS